MPLLLSNPLQDRYMVPCVFQFMKISDMNSPGSPMTVTKPDKICGSRIQPVQEPRKRDSLSDVVYARDPRKCAFNAEAEACMRD